MWCGRREHLRELDCVLGAADGVVEAEVAAVGGGGLVGGDVRVGQEVDVDGDEDAAVVHVGGALEVGVRGGEPEPRGAGEQAGVDGHHVDATVHGQRPRRLLRQRLGQGVPQLQKCTDRDRRQVRRQSNHVGSSMLIGGCSVIIGTMRPSRHDEAIRISKAESLKENNTLGAYVPDDDVHVFLVGFIIN